MPSTLPLGSAASHQPDPRRSSWLSDPTSAQAAVGDRYATDVSPRTRAEPGTRARQVAGLAAPGNDRSQPAMTTSMTPIADVITSWQDTLAPGRSTQRPAPPTRAAATSRIRPELTRARTATIPNPASASDGGGLAGTESMNSIPTPTASCRAG